MGSASWFSKRIDRGQPSCSANLACSVSSWRSKSARETNLSSCGRHICLTLSGLWSIHNGGDKEHSTFLVSDMAAGAAGEWLANTVPS